MYPALKGEVFLLYHDLVWTPFLIFGNWGCEYSTFYLNGGRVLKRKFDITELKDTDTVRFIGGIELTKFILDILEKRGRNAERLLDAIFDYVRGQETE